jgi:hypothetical protein
VGYEPCVRWNSRTNAHNAHRGSLAIIAGNTPADKPPLHTFLVREDIERIATSVTAGYAGTARAGQLAGPGRSSSDQPEIHLRRRAPFLPSP